MEGSLPEPRHSAPYTSEDAFGTRTDGTQRLICCSRLCICDLGYKPHSNFGCTKCHVYRFCSKECQVANWHEHKQMCRIWSLLSHGDQKLKAEQFQKEIYPFKQYLTLSELHEQKKYRIIQTDSPFFLKTAEKFSLGACAKPESIHDQRLLASEMFFMIAYSTLHDKFHKRNTIKLLEKSVELSGQNTSSTVYRILADVYKEVDEIENARHNIELALAKVTSDEELEFCECLNIKVYCYAANGEYSLAEKDIQIALEIIGTRQWTVLLPLTMVLARCKYRQKKYTEAVELFEKYPQFQDNECKYQNAFNVAAILFRVGIENQTINQSESIGIFNDAQLLLETIIDGDTYSNIDYCKLGLAYVLYQLGDHDKAIETLQDFLNSYIRKANLCCENCRQERHVDDGILKCDDCGVTRFCNRVCQFKSTQKNRGIPRDFIIRHQHLCPIIFSWKQAIKNPEQIHSCVADQILFLKKHAWIERL